MFGEEFPQSRILSFWDVGGLLKMRKGLGFGRINDFHLVLLFLTLLFKTFLILK